MYKKVHVYDLDGVLVDSSHRYRNKSDGSIDLDYWFKMRTAENIHKDKLLPLAKKYTADTIDPEIYTILCTARAMSVPDLSYIIGFLGMPDKLFMRAEGDTTHDAILKRKQLLRIVNLKQFQHLPRFFWDDNVRNLRASLDLFTRCFLVKSEICK